MSLLPPLPSQIESASTACTGIFLKKTKDQAMAPINISEEASFHDSLVQQLWKMYLQGLQFKQGLVKGCVIDCKDW